MSQISKLIIYSKPEAVVDFKIFATSILLSYFADHFKTALKIF